MPTNQKTLDALGDLQKKVEQAQTPVTPHPQQSQQPQQPQVAPEDFDYKTSVVNQRGESLPAGAQGWTPMGNPYFGSGIAGTLKKYAWGLFGSPTQGTEEDRWARFYELTTDPNGGEAAMKEAPKLLAGGLFGTKYDQESGKQNLESFGESTKRLQEIQQQFGEPGKPNQLREGTPEGVKAEFEKLSKEQVGFLGKGLEGKTSLNIGGSQVSLLSPLLRGSKVAMEALMDVLEEASVKYEQSQGAMSAIRDYADENSSLPGLAFDIDRKSEDKAEAWQNSANIASRVLVPMVQAWDAFRFITAPGTLKEKQKAYAEGFDAGRILYSQSIKPALLEEYKRRVADGEDPQLVAMELQNPWAEAIGQAILDPLNVVGSLSKGAKVAAQLDKAQDAVTGGKLGEAATELLKDAEKLGETRAAGKMDEFDNLVTAAVDRLEKSRLTPEYNKWTAYSPSGLRIREMKTVGETSAIVTSSIMRNGGSADEVADFFHYISKATSTDKAVRMEAWDSIFTLSQRFGLGRYPLSDDMLETGILLRNLTEDKDLLGILKAGKGDLSETAKILDRTLQRSIEKQIPTVSELKKAGEAAKDLGATAETVKKAQMYDDLKPLTKTLWNLQEGSLGKFKQGVNSFLGKFFFAQPGFVARNASNNFVTMFVDSGFQGTAKSFYRDGKFWSIADIESDLKTYFGGKLPPATQGITLSKAEHAESAVTKLNDAVESGFAKRIYWSRFRDTMDKFMRPGVALPSKEEFRALGMSDEAVDHFVHVLKNETHGNVAEAVTKYAAKHGENGLLDLWKRWNGSVSTQEMNGLSELGITKEIDNIVETAKTPQEITERIKKLRDEIKTRAASVVDNPVGVNRERKGFEFMDGIGKAAQEGLLDADGTNRLNILIEQSEKSSDEFMKALGKARDTVQDPALRQQFGVMEEAFSAEARNAARQTSQQATDTAWALTKRAKKSTGLQVEAMWDESILAKSGPAPKGLTQQTFLDELWKATRNEVSNTWEGYFADGFDRLSPLVDNLTEQLPELQPLFAKAQKGSAELNMYRTAAYRDGKIFYSQPPANVRELASRYGIATASAQGVPNDRQLLATINKYSGQKFKTIDEVPLDMAEQALQAQRTEKGGQAAKVTKAPTQPELSAQPVTMEEATKMPRGELPPEVGQRFEQEAHRLMDELNSGTGPTVQQAKQGTDAFPTTATPSTNADWYRELPRSLQNKKTLNAALEKIIKDKGSDKGVTVERLKELIIERFRYGSEGAPPDLQVLKGLGADEKVLQSALDDYNDFTKQELTLEEVLGNAPTEQIDNAAELAPDATQPYYDDAGNLIEPKNPEVQIHPPYVDGSTPIPGQMWKENSDGVIAALNKVESYMLDNYGVKAAEKLPQGKALSTLMQKHAGKITEGIAVADKVGKEWRDFALLPYGETKNFDLAISYAFPYQFWYSRSYTNWMKRIATDPQVIANYARLKEAMSKINKDSPEWWRYNLEVPSHFLGLPNEHPMSFNLEANLWPLYGLTGTDFEDPQKRQNWFTATVDDMGKFGPSPFSPIQWAIALAYRAKGENELAQAWAGRIIPQTATIKAVSSYFGKPVELDPAVQLFSGKGLMDFEAMDKYERNRVGRAIGAMVQDGLLTQEQAIEVARTQEGPAWDEAVKRATQIRAPGQIASYFLGVGMKARTQEDRVTDQFYQEYYRLNNLSQAGLVSPDQYKQAWDGLRDKYPFAETLLLSRKAGPDRDRAYAYNVLSRIPPGQASEIYKSVGISPELAQQFYDSKGDIKGWSQSDKDSFMAKMIDLGAMLAIPEYATRQEWGNARTEYKNVQESMKSRFGSDVLDKIEEYYSIDNTDQRKNFLELNPNVQMAMDYQTQATVNNPDLYSFYGGIQTLEKYWKGKVYDQLEEKYGADIQDKVQEYNTLKLVNPAQAKTYYRQHSEIKAYNKEKSELMDEALKKIVEFAQRLPEEEKPALTGNEPNSVGQENLYQYATQTAPTFQEFQQSLPIESQLIQEYWTSGEDIPYEVKKSLDYKAQRLGYQDGDDLLEAILIALPQ